MLNYAYSLLDKLIHSSQNWPIPLARCAFELWNVDMVCACDANSELVWESKDGRISVNDLKPELDHLALHFPLPFHNG